LYCTGEALTVKHLAEASLVAALPGFIQPVLSASLACQSSFPCDQVFERVRSCVLRHLLSAEALPFVGKPNPHIHETSDGYVSGLNSSRMFPQNSISARRSLLPWRLQSGSVADLRLFAEGKIPLLAKHSATISFKLPDYGVELKVW